MAEDPFEDLLELESGFYKEGYDAGVADSTYAGRIEGKVFGIEKGYEKALELAKMHGRATVWKVRIAAGETSLEQASDRGALKHGDDVSSASHSIESMTQDLGGLPKNSRLQKHIEALLLLTDARTARADNSDEAVTEFDDRLAKARAKAKVVSNIVGEPLNPTARANAGIEDATGLNARH